MPLLSWLKLHIIDIFLSQKMLQSLSDPFQGPQAAGVYIQYPWTLPILDKSVMVFVERNNLIYCTYFRKDRALDKLLVRISSITAINLALRFLAGTFLNSKHCIETSVAHFLSGGLDIISFRFDLYQTNLFKKSG